MAKKRPAKKRTQKKRKPTPKPKTSTEKKPARSFSELLAGFNTNFLFWILLFAIAFPPYLHGLKTTPVVEHVFTKDAFLSMLIGLSVLIWLISQFLVRDSRFKIHCSALGVVLFSLLILGAVSVLWAANTGHFLQKWFLWLIGAYGFAIALTTQEREKRTDVILWAMVIAGLITAVIGVGQYIYNLDIVAQHARPASTFGNRNMATHVIVLTMPAAWYLFWKVERPKNALAIDFFLAVAIFVMFLFLFQAATRSAWIGIAAEVLVLSFLLLAMRLRKTLKVVVIREKWIAIVISMLMVLPFFFLKYQVIDGVGQTSFYDPTGQVSRVSNVVTEPRVQVTEDNANIRLKIWDVSIKTIKDKPILGYGLGNWKHAYRSAGHMTFSVSGTARAHNDVIELGVELGIVGWAFFVLAGLIVLFYIVKIILRTKAPSTTATQSIFIFTAIAGTTLQAQFSFPYTISVPTLLLGTWLGLLTANYNRENPSKTISLEGLYKHVPALVLVPIMLLMLYANNYWTSMFEKLNDNFRNRYWANLPIKEYAWLENKYFYTALDGIANITYQKSPEFSIAVTKNLEESIFVEYATYYRLGSFAVNKGKYKQGLAYYAKALEVKPIGSNNIMKVIFNITRAIPKQRPLIKAFMFNDVQPILDKDKKERSSFYKLSGQIYEKLGETEKAKAAYARGAHYYPENDEFKSKS